MLTTFSTQLIRNGVRVSRRDVNARSAKRYTENGTRPIENAASVSATATASSRGERAAFEERDDDRAREPEVERGGGRDDDHGEPQPARSCARSAVRSPRAATMRELGRDRRRMIDTASRPCGSWKNVYAFTYTNGPPDVPFPST